MNILIADDEIRLRKVVALYMRKCGHKVTEAENGAEALDIALKTDQDVIIMDVIMPKLTGIDATIEMRKNNKLKNKPIILLTANASEADHKIGIEAGANEYITKPFSPKKLMETIKKIKS